MSATDDAFSAAVFVSSADLAALMQVGRATISRWVALGKIIPPLRIGRRCRWRKADIAAWLDAGMPSADEWQARQALKRQPGKPRN